MQHLKDSWLSITWTVYMNGASDFEIPHQGNPLPGASSCYNPVSCIAPLYGHSFAYSLGLICIINILPCHTSFCVFPCKAICNTAGQLIPSLHVSELLHSSLRLLLSVCHLSECFSTSAAANGKSLPPPGVDFFPPLCGSRLCFNIVIALSLWFLFCCLSSLN